MNLPPVRVCSNCGEEFRGPFAKCWLCLNKPSRGIQRLTSDSPSLSDGSQSSSANPFAVNPYYAVRNSNDEKQSAWDTFFFVLLGLVGILALLIGIGFAIQDPGMLIPYAIVVGPSFLAVFIQLLGSGASNTRVKPKKLLFTAFITGVITVSIIIVLFAVAIIALFVVCVSSFAK